MNTYHKIQTIFKRDPTTKYKTLLPEFSLPEFEYLKNNTWEFTEKIDGTNVRIMWDGAQIMFAGKTDRANLPPNLQARLAELFDHQIDMFKTCFPEGVCFYGEGYGNKIQKRGSSYLDHQDFILFDVKIGRWWLTRKDVNKIASEFKIDTVPVIGRGTLKDAVTMARKGFNSQWGNFIAEGIVLRPEVELFARNGNRIIAKIKYQDFITNKGENNGK